MATKKRISQGGHGYGKPRKTRRSAIAKTLKAKRKTAQDKTGDSSEKKKKNLKVPKRTFEECYPEIERLVERVRPQWTLDAVPHISFDDIKAIIIAHIFKKWDYYNHDLPLANWVATITKRQFINQLRNLYLSTQRPCSRCPANLGGDQCKLFDTQCEECSLYAEWKRTKFNQHQARLPLPIENHQHEISDRPDMSFDFEKMASRLHLVMKKILKPNQWRVYEALYINHSSEDDVAQQMGFRTSEAGRRRGYRRIMQIKKEIIFEAKRVLSGENEQIDIYSV